MRNSQLKDICDYQEQKKYYSGKQKRHTRKSQYKSVLLTVCGLVRLRIGSLILEIIESSKSGEVIDVRMSHSFMPKLDFVPLNPY